jgi:hypothetical protein
MSNLYRLYFLRQGHIIERDDIRAHDDAVAERVAALASQASQEEHDHIELWQGTRSVLSASRAEKAV